MAVLSEKALITESTLTDIADAIRAKLGTTDTYIPANMAPAIRSIMIVSIDATTASIQSTPRGNLLVFSDTG